MPAAVVTGASSGIGLELAGLLAADKYDVFLVARREPLLREIAEDLTRRHGIRAVPIVADLARPEGCALVAERVQNADVRALVNSAGFGVRGRFSETALDRDVELIDVNVRALTHLTKLLLPGMLVRRSGRILNVASTAAFQPGPLMGVYYASKAYVLSFSIALSVELEHTGVTCTALCPGPTRTAFQAVAGVRETLQGARWTVMAADAVARAGYRGMLRGKPVVIPGTFNRLLAFGTRLVPRRLSARIARKSQELRGGKAER
jgi:short-subunit dehydrogenase